MIYKLGDLYLFFIYAHSACSKKVRDCRFEKVFASKGWNIYISIASPGTELTLGYSFTWHLWNAVRVSNCPLCHLAFRRTLEFTTSHCDNRHLDDDLKLFTKIRQHWFSCIFMESWPMDTIINIYINTMYTNTRMYKFVFDYGISVHLLLSLFHFVCGST